MTHEIRDQRRPGWLWLRNEIIDQYGAELGAIGIAVYVALCKHADNDTQECFPSHAAIGKAVGLSAPTVRKALDKLCDLNIIAREQRFDESGRQTSNLYYLLDLPPVEKPDTPPQYKSNRGVGYTDLPRTRLNELDSMNKTGSLVSGDDLAAIQSGDVSAKEDAPPKPRRNTTPKSSMDTTMAQAVASVCRQDLRIEGVRAHITPIAADLSKVGYKPEQVARLYGRGGWWYLNDWRGQKGSVPTPKQIEATIALATQQQPRAPRKRSADGAIRMPSTSGGRR